MTRNTDLVLATGAGHAQSRCHVIGGREPSPEDGSYRSVNLELPTYRQRARQPAARGSLSGLER